MVMEVSSLYKAQKGLIKVRADIEGNVINDIEITGDFFMIPESALPELEMRLIGKRLERAELEETLEQFYITGVETPLLTKDDFVNAVLGVKNANKTA
jgi:hypothetical protein